MGVTQGNIVVGLGEGTVKLGAYGAVEGSCVDVGATEGGVEISMPREYYEKMCDQTLGVIDFVKTSEKCTIKVSLAESTLANHAKAMDYNDSVAVAAGVLSFGGNADVNYLTIFLNVVGPTGGTRQYHFWKCVCTSASTHSYKKNDKTIVECEFGVIQDLTKTADQQFGTVTDTGSDTTAPTIALTTPAAGGTVTKDTKGTVTLTITETNAMNENTIVYGDTINIMNITTPATPVLVAGSIVYNSVAKTVVFTPTANWTASDALIVVCTKGLKDAAGNSLAAVYTEDFTVTA
jgi:hypothetical protein